MATLIVQVPEGALLRADQLLARSLPDLSRRRIQTLLAKGQIRIDGRRVRKGQMFSGATALEVEVQLPSASPLSPEAEPAVAVLYEDDTLVALDKPAGRPGHALRSEDRGTVANFLSARYPETRDAGHSSLEHGLVHRLDTDTSGVLLAARNRETWDELRRQFREREVEKRYLTLVIGSVTDPGEITRPIESGRRSGRRVRVLGQQGPQGRPARTHYRPIAGYRGFTLLEVKIHTGVMHQIRAHLAAEGHPIVGDAVYGKGACLPIDVPRHLLHAASIEVTHPVRGERLRIESPLPRDFSEVLAGLANDKPATPRGCC